jgi:hypothetical protein
MSQAGNIGAASPSGQVTFFNTTPVSIDLTKMQTTLLYTVPAGKTFFPLWIVVGITSDSNDGDPAFFSVGTNSPTYDTISGGGEQQAIANSPYLPPPTIYTLFTPGGSADDTEFLLPTSGQQIYFNTQTKSTNTTSAATVYLTGYFQ